MASLIERLLESFKPRSPPPKDKRPVVICGLSGVGKTTLITKLRQTYPKQFTATVSHTTRPKRKGEKNHVDYHFTSIDDFVTKLISDEFVEYSIYCGNFYGTSIRTLRTHLKKKRITLMGVNMHGVRQLKVCPGFKARYVFITPPSLEVLETRLRSRRSETEEDMQERLASARAELEYAQVDGAYDLVIPNDNLDEAFQMLSDFIFKPNTVVVI